MSALTFSFISHHHHHQNNPAVGLEFADNKFNYDEQIQKAQETAPKPQDWAPPPIPPYPDATDQATISIVHQIISHLHIGNNKSNTNNIVNGTGGGGDGDGANKVMDAEELAVLLEQLRMVKKVLETQVVPCIEEADRRGTDKASPAEVLSTFPLGFSTNDPQVDVAAMVLRLLYIKDVRQLQDQIDTAIVRMQELTANPKTDAARGKVGRK